MMKAAELKMVLEAVEAVMSVEKDSAEEIYTAAK